MKTNCCKFMRGFTLAETLITLTIIGVVVAITIPSIVANHQKMVYTTRLHKSVNSFSAVAESFIYAEGKQNLAQTGIFDSDDVLNQFILSNMRVVKSCSTNEGGCFASVYRSVDGDSSESFSCGNTSYVLADSSALCVTAEGNSDNNPYLKVVVDTNGTAKPNIGGRDLFEYYINRRGELLHSMGDSTPSEGDCTSDAMGEVCFQIIREANWKMRY